jgi:hypothetical protein
MNSIIVMLTGLVKPWRKQVMRLSTAAVLSVPWVLWLMGR